MEGSIGGVRLPEFIQHVLKKELLAHRLCVPPFVFESVAATKDFFMNSVILETKAYFASKTSGTFSGEIEAEHLCDRPSFLDWLLRRRKKVVFTVPYELKVKDVFKHTDRLKDNENFFVFYDFDLNKEKQAYRVLRAEARE